MRRPFLVMGPDLDGATIYARCRTLKNARRYSRGMEAWWTIVRIVHPAKNLEADKMKRRRTRRKTLARLASGGEAPDAG